MQRARILLITDNLESADMLAHGLAMRKVDVVIAAISGQFQQGEQIDSYTLIIVDTERTDAIVLCRQLRAEYKNPLLFLTYETDERYHLLVYEAGVDECIQKPIGNTLFLCKVNVWLRSMRPLKPLPQLSQREFSLDAVHRCLTTPEGNVVTLTPLETRLFQLFMNNPAVVLDTETIIRRIWNDYSMGDNVLLKNLIYRIRRKIEPSPSTPHYIQTAFSGYIFYPSNDD
jgi:DNA-binding response OmpR family regulator